jgi:oxygen-independent coproporphyrinogen-3 oxidase
MSTGGVGLYIHVPFCTTKCGYCDFYSLPLADRSTAPLVECLIQELERRARAYAGRVSTVFIGGGTPTLLPPDDLRRLLETVAGMLGPDRVDEFTVEANPATLDPTKAAILVEAGVDRISFGAQSFHPGELAALERIHDPDDVERSIVVARNAGFRPRHSNRGTSRSPVRSTCDRTTWRCTG